MKRLRIAVVGAGHLGCIHARLLKSVDDVELIGVVDSAPSRAGQTAELLDTAGFTDHRQLAGKIDAAVVAVPSTNHHAVGLELLSAGIHLLVEKPLATSVAQADALIAAARLHGAVLQVGHVERFNPALTAVESLPGRPRYIEAVRCGRYTGRSTDIGAVFDLMIHDIDVVLSLVRSELVDVQASGSTLIGPHEDQAEARLTFADGCVANLRASRISRQPARTMQIHSDDAYADVDFSGPAASVVLPDARLLRGEIEFENLSGDQRRLFIDELFSRWLPEEQLAVEASNAILEEQQDFITSIRSNSLPRVTGEQARDAIAVAERILAAIQSQALRATMPDHAQTIALPTGRLPSPAAIRRAG